MRTLLVGLVVVAIGACAPDEPPTATSTAATTSSNALTTNALAANGMFQNGMFQNGMFQNGMFQNGLYQGDLFQDGVLQDGLWRDEVWQRNPAALEVLRTNPYTRQVLQYIYGCAMRPAGSTGPDDPGQSVTLDPDVPPGDSTPVELKGEIGLWPDWGEKGGTCGLSCQRWVSACVLARTNAYGVKVHISMRVPDDDDVPEHIKKALKVHRDADASRDEVKLYPLREGAFYGNLFQTTFEDGFAKSTPMFYACAGPGSNIPQITKRFCSSQGADGPITVVGACESREVFSEEACDDVKRVEGTTNEEKVEDTGALHHCFTNRDHTGPKFTEVITVYLRKPLAVCGDSVCDQGEEEGEEASCPSDCHPGGWAKTFPLALDFPAGGHAYGDPDGPLSTGWFHGITALGSDDTLVVVGTSQFTVDLGGGPLLLDPNAREWGLLAEYDADGRYLWGKRFDATYFLPGGVALANDRSIIVTGIGWPESRYYLWPALWLVKSSADGTPVWTMASSVSSWNLGWADSRIAPAVDVDGNIFVTGRFAIEMVLGDTRLTTPGDRDIFVAKISPAGALLWIIAIGEGGNDQPTTLAVDRYGDVLLGLWSTSMQTGLMKLSGADGSTIWKRRGQHWAVTSDANGDVYATGSLSDPSMAYHLDSNTYDFTIPASAGPFDFFVAKYPRGGGRALYVHTVPMSCRSEVPGAPCNGRFDGRTIALDAAGNVIVGIHGGNRAPIDFGTGAFDTYQSNDVFVASFSPELEFRWIKHMPMILDGVHRGLGISSRGRIVMSGIYAGSTQIDDRLLVNDIPEQPRHGNTFLATFAMPSELDVTAPVMLPEHVPLPTIVQATGADGAQVFFMPPTAIDASTAGVNSGVSVSCVPAPNTKFPIGDTQVTCTVSDPRGNHSTSTFLVTVVDTLGPSFAGVPAPITVEATGPAGAIVSFEPPTAVDLVDGPRPVTCSPSSGTMFPLGTTVVQCSSSDTKGHETQTAFGVTVLLTWSGVLSPVNADGTSSFKLGSTITVKYQLTGASSPITNAAATLSLVKWSPDPTGTVIEATSPGNHNTGNRFRYDASSGQYIYNLSTKPLSAGIWSLRIDPGDEVPRAVTISLHE